MNKNIVYSHLLHDRMPEAKKISHSNEVSILSFDLYYAGNTEIVLRIPMDDQHFDWFVNTWCSYLKIESGVFREAGDCNTVLVETQTGFIIIDPSKTYGSNSWLALKFRNQPLEAVLFTHAHHDHWNGINFWNISDDTLIIIQEKYQHTLDYRNKLQNFYKRRNKSFTGGLWKVNKELEFPEPTETFNSDKQLKISNQVFSMINTPTETSDTSIIWFPELKLLCAGDTVSSGFPMLGTPRGSYPRFAEDYTNAIDRILELCPELLITGHGEPVKGFKHIETRLTKNKKAIVFVDNAVCAGINNGKDVHTLISEISFPDNLSFSKGFGKVSWAIRGLYNNYVGWFNGKLNNIFDTPVSSVYKDLINISGIDPMLELIRDKLKNNNPEKALHLTEIILIAFPDNEEILPLRKEACKLLLNDSSNWVESNFIKEELLNSEAN